MERLVVDTSVVSYLFKRHPLAAAYGPHLEGNLLGLSFMSVAELYRWPLERGWGEIRLAALKEHLKDYVVLPSDDAISWTWARIMSQKGKPRAIADAWIAATALRHGAALVTHNAKHFEGIPGLEIVTVPE